MGQLIRRHMINQIFSSITAFLTVFLSGVWLGWISAVLPKFKAGEIPITVTSDDLTWMVALMDFGNLLSPIPCGYLMDRFGRLFPLRLASILFGVTSVLALTATTPYHLYAARLLAGVGKGIGFTAASIYVAEIAEPKIRGALSGIFVVMLLGGTAVSMSIGPFISFQNLNWITLLFPTVQLILSFFIVESPYYFLIRKNEKSATEVFSKLRDRSKVTSNNAELEVIRKKVEEDMEQPKQFSSLFSGKGNIKALIIVLVTAVLQRSGGISCTLAYSSTTLPTDTFWNKKITIIVFAWSCVIFGLSSMSLVDRFGRKPLQIFSTFGLGVITATSAVFYYFYQLTTVDVSRFVWVPHVGVMLFGAVYSVGIGQIPHTLQSELFPTSTKSQASALMTMALGVSSFIVNKIYFTVDQEIGVYCMFLIFAVSNFLCMVFTAVYIFETKGKSLPEIQDILNK